MDYKEARKRLNNIINSFDPVTEDVELLSKALQAINDCLEMGLNGEGD